MFNEEQREQEKLQATAQKRQTRGFVNESWDINILNRQVRWVKKHKAIGTVPSLEMVDKIPESLRQEKPPPKDSESVSKFENQSCQTTRSLQQPWVQPPIWGIQSWAPEIGLWKCGASSRKCTRVLKRRRSIHTHILWHKVIHTFVLEREWGCGSFLKRIGM